MLRTRRLQRSCKLTEPQLRAAYALYSRKGLSLRQLALMIWEKYGYASPNSCELGLKRAFQRNGWRIRSRREAMRLHKQQFYGTTRRARDDNGKVMPEYSREYYRLRRQKGNARCGVETETGHICRRWRERGEAYCYGHNPKYSLTRRLIAVAHNERMRREREERVS